jgi:hypothetical protein
MDAVTVEVQPAARRLVAAEDPVLGLDLRVILPPQTLETAGGLPVVYLGGTVDPLDYWQSTAVTAFECLGVGGTLERFMPGLAKRAGPRGGLRQAGGPGRPG